MFNEKAKAVDKTTVAVVKNDGLIEGVGAGGIFTFKCFDKDGNLKWEDSSHNLVVNVGLQDMNAKYFSGAGYSATWYLGLINNTPSPSYAAGDTLASPSWTETTAYAGNRKAVTFGTASTANPSVISNTASPAVFTMNGTVTVAGAFLCNVDTGTSGILFSASTFQAPGARSVVSGDVLNVTYQFSLTAT
jgi:hypothetical protein